MIFLGKISKSGNIKVPVEIQKMMQLKGGDRVVVNFTVIDILTNVFDEAEINVDEPLEMYADGGIVVIRQLGDFGDSDFNDNDIND